MEVHHSMPMSWSSLQMILQTDSEWHNIQDIIRTVFQALADQMSIQTHDISKMRVEMKELKMENELLRQSAAAAAKEAKRRDKSEAVLSTSSNNDQRLEYHAVELQALADELVKRKEQERFLSKQIKSLETEVFDIVQIVDLKADLETVSEALIAKANKDSVSKALQRRPKQDAVDAALDEIRSCLTNHQQHLSEMINVHSSSGSMMTIPAGSSSSAFQTQLKMAHQQGVEAGLTRQLHQVLNFQKSGASPGVDVQTTSPQTKAVMQHLMSQWQTFERSTQLALAKHMSEWQNFQSRLQQELRQKSNLHECQEQMESCSQKQESIAQDIQHLYHQLHQPKKRVESVVPQHLSDSESGSEYESLSESLPSDSESVSSALNHGASGVEPSSMDFDNVREESGAKNKGVKKTSIMNKKPSRTTGSSSKDLTKMRLGAKYASLSKSQPSESELVSTEPNQGTSECEQASMDFDQVREESIEEESGAKIKGTKKTHIMKKKSSRTTGSSSNDLTKMLLRAKTQQKKIQAAKAQVSPDGSSKSLASIFALAQAKRIARQHRQKTNTSSKHPS